MKVGIDIYWIGARHPARKKFKHIIKCEYGTTYNSYLILDELNVVVDGVPRKFENIWLRKLNQLCNSVEYVVATHASPHKTESFELLLKEFPSATLIGSSQTLEYIKNILEIDFNGKVVKDGDRIVIGEKELEVMEMSYWPWPGTIMLYDSQEASIFSAGGFSAHYCEEAILYSELAYPKKYKEFLRKYFRYTLLPYRKHLKVGLSKIGTKYLKKIYPSYGPIIDVNADKIIELYDSWLAPEHKAVSILYVSVYGYTEKMARSIAEGVREIGIDTIMLDLDEVSREEILEALTISKGILIGTPTIYEAIPAKILNILSLLPYVPDWREKKIGIFGCETYSTSGVDMLENILKTIGAKYVFGTLKASINPKKEDLHRCIEFGKTFAALV